jgi:hypothetical protein
MMHDDCEPRPLWMVPGYDSEMDIIPQPTVVQSDIAPSAPNAPSQADFLERNLDSSEAATGQF